MRAKGQEIADRRRALYEAGWSVEELAEHEGTSVDSMLGYLRSRCGVEFKHEVTTAPDADEVLLAIATQMCPWCDRGPFRLLPHHTRLIHGVDAEQLCEWADIPKTWATCDPDLAELHREITTARGVDPEYMSAISKLADPSDRTLTKAGRRVIQETIRETQERLGPARVKEIADYARSFIDQEELRRLGEHFGRVRAEQVRKIPAEDYPRIVERLALGETTSDIAAEYGVTRDYIGSIRRGERPRRGLA